MAVNFAADESYKEAVSKYTKTDGICAIALYILLVLLTYLIGVLFLRKQIYLGVPLSLLLCGICILLVLLRKQKLTSIGFTTKNVWKAFFVGSILGIIYTFLDRLPSIMAGARITPSKQEAYNIFYYFVIIALTEEIIFRGYIQTRMYGLVKNDFAAIVITGAMFYFAHLPFQTAVNGMQFNIGRLIGMIGLHYVKHLMYCKYNSIVAPTVFHGILDWSRTLLR